MPVDLDLPLIVVASSGNNKGLELLAIGLDVKLLARDVVHGDLVLVHVAVDLVQDGRKVELQLVRLLSCGEQKLHGGLAVLLDLALDIELVQHKVGLLLVDEDLVVASPLLELGQESVLADDSSEESAVGVHHQGVLDPDDNLVAVNPLLGVKVKLHHLLAGLLGQDVDVSAFLSVGGTVSLNVDAAGDVGVKHNAAADVVGHCGLDLIVLDVPPLEHSGGNKQELVGLGSGVELEVNSLLAILVQVDLNKELVEEQVAILFVHKDMNSVLPGLEGAIGVDSVKEVGEHGVRVEGHVSDQVHLEFLRSAHSCPLGLVGPHGDSILLGLDVSAVAGDDLNSQLDLVSVKVILQVQLAVLKLHLNCTSQGASQQRILGLGLKVQSGPM